MPDHYDPTEVHQPEKIQDIIRSSFYAGNATSFMEVAEISWGRLRCTAEAFSHAYMDMFVEPLQFKFGQDIGYAVGHILGFALPASVITLLVIVML